MVSVILWLWWVGLVGLVISRRGILARVSCRQGLAWSWWGDLSLALVGWVSLTEEI